MIIGFYDVLTLIFVVAKITGTITWSWWLVLSPFLFQSLLRVALELARRD